MHLKKTGPLPVKKNMKNLLHKLTQQISSLEETAQEMKRLSIEPTTEGLEDLRFIFGDVEEWVNCLCCAQEELVQRHQHLLNDTVEETVVTVDIKEGTYTKSLVETRVVPDFSYDRPVDLDPFAEEPPQVKDLI